MRRFWFWYWSRGLVQLAMCRVVLRFPWTCKVYALAIRKTLGPVPKDNKTFETVPSVVDMHDVRAHLAKVKKQWTAYSRMHRIEPSRPWSRK